MSDYIKREDAINEICRKGCQMERANRFIISMHEAKQFAVDVLDDIPAADVREDKKGMWLHDKDDEIISGYCNCCGWAAIVMETDVADMPFCPNCGADMRGANDG